MRYSGNTARVLGAVLVMALAAAAPGPAGAQRSTVEPAFGEGPFAAPAEVRIDGPAPTAAPEPAEGRSASEQGASAAEHTDHADGHDHDEATRSSDAVPASATLAGGDFFRDVHVLYSKTTTPAESPEVRDGTPCPRASTCDLFSLRPERWETEEAGRITIPWRFNDEGRRNLRAPAGLLESAMRHATQEWSRWNSNVNFAYEGTTAATFGASGPDGSCADGSNTVTWSRFEPHVIAAVVTCIDRRTRRIVDADLALNVTQRWEDIVGEPKSRHTFDIRSIVTHEIGHWLSLMDLYTSAGSAQTMSGTSSYGETRKRTLALGDIMGIQTAYPCGPDASCPRSGIVDD